MQSRVVRRRRVIVLIIDNKKKEEEEEDEGMGDYIIYLKFYRVEREREREREQKEKSIGGERSFFFVPPPSRRVSYSQVELVGHKQASNIQ